MNRFVSNWERRLKTALVLTSHHHNTRSEQKWINICQSTINRSLFFFSKHVKHINGNTLSALLRASVYHLHHKSWAGVWNFWKSERKKESMEWLKIWKAKIICMEIPLIFKEQRACRWMGHIVSAHISPFCYWKLTQNSDSLSSLSDYCTGGIVLKKLPSHLILSFDIFDASILLLTKPGRKEYTLNNHGRRTLRWIAH